MGTDLPTRVHPLGLSFRGALNTGLAWTEPVGEWGPPDWSSCEERCSRGEEPTRGPRESSCAREGRGRHLGRKTRIGKREKALLPEKEGPRRGLFFAASDGEEPSGPGTEEADGPDIWPPPEGPCVEIRGQQVAARRQVSTPCF